MARRAPLLGLLFLLAALPADTGTAQQPDDPITQLEATPPELAMQVGDEVAVTVTGITRSGVRVEAPPIRLVGPRDGMRVRGGTVTALAAGEFTLIATLIQEGPPPGTAPVTLRVPVTIGWPPIARVAVTPTTGHRLLAGTTLRLRARAEHADGSTRPGTEPEWRSGSPGVATVDRFGRVTAHAPGTATITATVDGVDGALTLTADPFTGTSLTITGGVSRARTGDVIEFGAQVRGTDGGLLTGVPVEWSHAWEEPEGVIAPSAPAQMHGSRFVADVPGIYTVIADAGPLTARTSFRVVQRDVIQQLEIHGQGREQRVRTTDFWVFEGLDGRDYALTGAKRSDGYGFVWDVTEPGNIVKTDSIQVDARSVNDIKVSPDARYATMTREGASNRRNGVVILDLSDPAHPKIASEVTDYGLTGGVHNAFPTNEHVFALAGGDKYVILDVSDIYNPRYVGELQPPGQPPPRRVGVRRARLLGRVGDRAGRGRRRQRAVGRLAREPRLRQQPPRSNRGDARRLPVHLQVDRQALRLHRRRDHEPARAGVGGARPGQGVLPAAVRPGDRNERHPAGDPGIHPDHRLLGPGVARDGGALRSSRVRYPQHLGGGRCPLSGVL